MWEQIKEQMRQEHEWEQRSGVRKEFDEVWDDFVSAIKMLLTLFVFFFMLGFIVGRAAV